jgi:hypothetical protein
VVENDRGDRERAPSRRSPESNVFREWQAYPPAAALVDALLIAALERGDAARSMRGRFDASYPTEHRAAPSLKSANRIARPLSGKPNITDGASAQSGSGQRPDRKAG